VSRKSWPIGFVKLHRIHAAPVATRVQFDDLGMTGRGEGGDPAHKDAMAYRLALCWNVLEGMPTSALADGMLRDIFMAIDAGDLAAAQALVARFDGRIDDTNGRPHDCKSCLKSEARDDEEPALALEAG
jgi:hypothetical protein